MFRSVFAALGRAFSSINSSISEALTGIWNDNRWAFGHIVRRPFLWCADKWDVVQPYAYRTALIGSALVEWPFRLIALAAGGANGANAQAQYSMEAAAANDNHAARAEAEAQRLEEAARREWEHGQKEAEDERARTCDFASFSVACTQMAEAVYNCDSRYLPDTTILTSRQAAWLSEMTPQEAMIIRGGKVSLRALEDFGRGRREIGGLRAIKSVSYSAEERIESKREERARVIRRELYERNGRFSR